MDCEYQEMETEGPVWAENPNGFISYQNREVLPETPRHEIREPQKEEYEIEAREE